MSRTAKPDELLTITEAARLVGLSRQAVHDAVERGSLPIVTVHIPAKRIRRADVVAYFKHTGGEPHRPKKTD